MTSDKSSFSDRYEECTYCDGYGFIENKRSMCDAECPKCEGQGFIKKKKVSACHNIRLVDVDSKIPNLALMKLSAYFKRKGFKNVGFDTINPCAVFVSCIFKKNQKRAENILKAYNGIYTDGGGVGLSLDSKLPPKIEYMRPDYSLYPDIDYSMGYTTRGCIRNCHFCVVPQKEGKVRFVQHPREFHDPRFDKIRFFDNNVLAVDHGKWFIHLCEWLNCAKIKADFMSGLDIRLMTDDIAGYIKRTRTWKPWKFAYDNTADTDAVLAGIEMLKRNGVNPRKCLFYVYVHDDNDVPIKAAHCDILKMNGATAYAMCNCDKPLSEYMRKLKRYTRPWVFWDPSCTSFYDYDPAKIHYNFAKDQSKLDVFGVVD